MHPLMLPAMLQFFDTATANKMRACCVEFIDPIAEYPWNDENTRVRGSVASWRRCFPRARAINLSRRNDLTDDDFVHLVGIKTLDMGGCSQSTITDAAFAHLTGIHTLNMSECRQSTITDAAALT